MKANDAPTSANRLSLRSQSIDSKSKWLSMTDFFFCAYSRAGFPLCERFSFIVRSLANCKIWFVTDGLMSKEDQSG